MKTRKFGVMLFILAIVMVATLAGCSNNPAKSPDNAVINTQKYENYDAWREQANEIRLMVDMKVNINNVEGDGISEIGDQKLPENKVDTLYRIKKGIYAFFKEEYQIDVYEKLQKQEIVVFSATGNQEGVMGYVTLDNPNVLNLNEKLFKEHSDKLETTYIHETLHHLVFGSEDVLFLEKGITDALTDMICMFLGIKPILTDYYFETRTLAYQLLAADPEIVSCYLEDEEFSIIDRINEKLKNIPQTFRKTENLGNLLETRVYTLYAISNGMDFGYSTDPYWLAFESQEIVKAYCQECEPDDTTIDYIRSHYLVLDYEDIVIEEDANGYRFYTE